MFLSKEKQSNYMNIIRVFAIFIIFCVIVGVLCFINLREIVRNLPVYGMLRDNLAFLSAVASRYRELFLFLFFLLLFVYIIYLKCNYRTSISEFTLAGISFTFKDPEPVIKVRVSNYLNTKRSLFYYYEGYDNLYDVMSSWHEILLFIREQLCFLEERNSDGKNSDFNKNLQELVAELNWFLTKYQSDYRRWYESQIKKEMQTTDKFRPLFFIQREYFLYDKIMQDIKLLNEKLRTQSNIWDVDCKRWERIR